MKTIILLTILFTIESNPVSGQESDEHFQGHATILLRSPYMGGYQYFPICGATVMDKNWLVTAGHRFTMNIVSDITELMVMITVREKYLVKERIFKTIDRFVHHPKFSSYPRIVNDIWLVKLKEATKFDDYFLPAKLSNRSDICTGFVADHGDRIDSACPESVSEKTEWIDLDFQTDEKCSNHLSGQLMNMFGSDMICASAKVGRAQCNVLGGAPLVQKISGDFTLVGITVIGPKPCGKEGVTFVFTKISNYVDWIEGVTGVKTL